ncbi:SDR family NAD(P)-dependent oxidoreductase [uncultured Corynebacterium sp.]|uniref:SDR family NAD(P)-dependent oxidoreductase n=1 Tax=uncultured Corynebacterium sp. TaxID=159447 RepID=UPI003458FC99
MYAGSEQGKCSPHIPRYDPAHHQRCPPLRALPALRIVGDEPLSQAGSSEDTLGPALTLPLGTLVELSGGQMPQEAVDQLVLAANGGVMPEKPAAEEIPSSQRFAGRTVIVTGAAGGIGKAVAALLATEGARVVATDVNGAVLTPSMGAGRPSSNRRICVR